MLGDRANTLSPNLTTYSPLQSENLVSCMMCYPVVCLPRFWSYTHTPSLSDLETYHRQRCRSERAMREVEILHDLVLHSPQR
jgi:hypothetical protein